MPIFGQTGCHFNSRKNLSWYLCDIVFVWSTFLRFFSWIMVCTGLALVSKRQNSTAEEIEVLSSDLSSAARSFALTNYSEIRTLLPPTATKQLVKQAAKHTASAAKRRLLNGSAKRKGKGYKSTIFPFVGALMLGLGLLTCALGVLMAVEPKAAAKITNSLTAGSVEWHTTGGAWSGMKTAPNVTAPQHMKQRRNKAEKVA